MPPDVTAGIFWLKNRDPAHWRDAWQIDHTMGKYVISDTPMTEEQWIRERATVIDGEATDVTRHYPGVTMNRRNHCAAVTSCILARYYMRVEDMTTWRDAPSDDAERMIPITTLSSR